MKKFKKSLASLGKSIYSIIDRFIVTPISKVVYVIGSKITKGNKLETILNRPNVLVYVSLALAVLVFYLVDSKAISLVQTNAEIIANQPINVIFNKSAYVVEGIPDNVDIILTGRKSDLYLAKQLGDHEVVLDLSDYEVSDEPVKVKLTYNKTIDSLNYKLDPSYVTVTIKKKISDIKPISYDLLNQDQLDEKLSVKKVKLSKTEVVVKGSQDTLAQIANVKALIDLSNKDFIDKGTYTVDNVGLVAYDSSGKILENVEIVPANLSAEIELDSYSKEVPIKVMTNGDLADTRAISSITINGKNEYMVTIYGDQEELESIDSVPVSIDVNGQGTGDSKKYPVTISKPSGVRYISDSSAVIELQFGTATQITIDNVQVEIFNVPSGLDVKAATSGEKYISIIAEGVESVLNDINAEDITAYIDVSNYTVGTHSVVVQVENNDPRVKFKASGTINVVIREAN